MCAQSSAEFALAWANIAHPYFLAAGENCWPVGEILLFEHVRPRPNVENSFKRWPSLPAPNSDEQALSLLYFGETSHFIAKELASCRGTAHGIKVCASAWSSRILRRPRIGDHWSYCPFEASGQSGTCSS